MDAVSVISYLWPSAHSSSLCEMDRVEQVQGSKTSLLCPRWTHCDLTPWESRLGGRPLAPHSLPAGGVCNRAALYWTAARSNDRIIEHEEEKVSLRMSRPGSAFHLQRNVAQRD